MLYICEYPKTYELFCGLECLVTYGVDPADATAVDVNEPAHWHLLTRDHNCAACGAVLFIAPYDARVVNFTHEALAAGQAAIDNCQNETVLSLFVAEILKLAGIRTFKPEHSYLINAGNVRLSGPFDPEIAASLHRVREFLRAAGRRQEVFTGQRYVPRDERNIAV